MNTLVFLRRPEVPVFWPSIGLVDTLFTVKPYGRGSRARQRLERAAAAKGRGVQCMAGHTSRQATEASISSRPGPFAVQRDQCGTAIVLSVRDWDAGRWVATRPPQVPLPAAPGFQPLPQASPRTSICATAATLTLVFRWGAAICCCWRERRGLVWPNWWEAAEDLCDPRWDTE